MRRTLRPVYARWAGRRRVSLEERKVAVLARVRSSEPHYRVHSAEAAPPSLASRRAASAALRRYHENLLNR